MLKERDESECKREELWQVVKKLVDRYIKTVNVHFNSRSSGLLWTCRYQAEYWPLISFLRSRQAKRNSPRPYSYDPVLATVENCWFSLDLIVRSWFGSDYVVKTNWFNLQF